MTIIPFRYLYYIFFDMKCIVCIRLYANGQRSTERNSLRFSSMFLKFCALTGPEKKRRGASEYSAVPLNSLKNRILGM